MKLRKIYLALTAALFACSAWAQTTATQDEQMQAMMKMLRQDVRKDYQAVVDQAMGLEAADKAKFWGVYEGYQNEMKALWDRRLANVKLYAENYDKMTDPTADKMAAASIANEQEDVTIRKKYYDKMKVALGSKNAARFWQVESMMARLVGLQLGAEIPLVK